MFDVKMRMEISESRAPTLLPDNQNSVSILPEAGATNHMPSTSLCRELIAKLGGYSSGVAPNVNQFWQGTDEAMIFRGESDSRRGITSLAGETSTRRCPNTG